MLMVCGHLHAKWLTSTTDSYQSVYFFPGRASGSLTDQTKSHLFSVSWDRCLSCLLLGHFVIKFFDFFFSVTSVVLFDIPERYRSRNTLCSLVKSSMLILVSACLSPSSNMITSIAACFAVCFVL